MSNPLIDRIDRIISHLLKKKHPGAGSVVPELKSIKKHIEDGGIPGPKEFRTINYYEPRSILPKCKFISPLWECRIGIMEHCKHRPEWEKGVNTCKKYRERIGK